MENENIEKTFEREAYFNSISHNLNELETGYLSGVTKLFAEAFKKQDSYDFQSRIWGIHNVFYKSLSKRQQMIFKEKMKQALTDRSSSKAPVLELKKKDE
jgi:hypothetical protein